MRILKCIKVCSGTILILPILLLPSGVVTAGKAPGNRYVYFMSKRNDYYGLYRSDLHRTEELYSSKAILEKFPNKARYQISYDVSPDGRYLAFNGLSGKGAMDIFLLDLYTRDLKNLTDDDSVDIIPVFSGDGRWIAYLSHDALWLHDNIVLMMRDGSGRRIVTHQFSRILSIEFFPGDEKILFVEYVPFHSMIASVNLENGRVTNLTDFTFRNRSPSLSPDGKSIVYASDQNGSFDIWIMKSSGSNKRLLYESPGLEYEPHFIESGKRIVFLSDFVPEKGNERIGNSIYTMNPDGTRLRNMLPLHYLNRNFFCSGLFPYRDGIEIYFEGRYADREKGKPSIYLLQVPSGRVRKIVKEKYGNTNVKTSVR
jgi:Tol biopolymer transport system component